MHSANRLRSVFYFLVIWNILLYGLSFSERAYLLIFAKQRDFLLLSAMGYLKWGENHKWIHPEAIGGPR